MDISQQKGCRIWGRHSQGEGPRTTVSIVKWLKSQKKIITKWHAISVSDWKFLKSPNSSDSNRCVLSPGHQWWGRWCSAKLSEWQGHSGILEFESQLNSSFFTCVICVTVYMAPSLSENWSMKPKLYTNTNFNDKRLRASNSTQKSIGNPNAEATWLWALCGNWQTWPVWRNSNGVNTFLERPEGYWSFVRLKHTNSEMSDFFCCPEFLPLFFFAFLNKKGPPAFIHRDVKSIHFAPFYVEILWKVIQSDLFEMV